jgi:hypothetical protein
VSTTRQISLAATDGVVDAVSMTRSVGGTSCAVSALAK